MEKVCKLPYAHIGEVLWAHAHEPPCRCASPAAVRESVVHHRCDRELSAQVVVFLLHARIILYQSGMPEEECLHLKKVIAVVGDSLQWQCHGPLFKGFCV